MRRSRFLFSVPAVLVGLVFLCSSAALADDDPPGRVARLNYIQGSVSFQPGGESDWVQANPNRPLTTGDNLWADRDSRGELHIGSSSIRIGSETGITFLNLNDRTIQIQVAQGSMNVHVRRLEGGDAFEIDTPNIAFTLERAGEYRVDVDPSGGSTTVSVVQGEGDATGGGSEYHMDSGDRATYSGTDTLTYDGGRVGSPDDFDNWCHSRDDREDRSASAQYVSRDVIGYDDLDGYGQWQNVPDYGYVWFPAGVAAGWAPYRFGHWVWIAPWGWTWVEDEPWGFAPFHYGRWAVVGGAWGWVPGPVVVRPVYAPALVVFVGGPRFGMSLSFGGGGVAWFPLGPREVYVPPYRVSERYVQNVNITNTNVTVVNVTNVYHNVNVTNVTYMHQNNVAAVTAVSHDTFVNARPVAAAAVHVNAQQMQGAQVQRNFTVAPVHQSVVGAAAVAKVAPPAAVMQRQVVVKETPAAPRAPVGVAAGAYNQPGRGPATKPVQGGALQPKQATQQPPQAQGNKGFQPATGQPPAQPQGRTPQQSFGGNQQPQQTPPNQAGRPAFQPPTGKTPAQPQATPTQPQQNPNVRYAPPAKAGESTYQPHQFERPPAPATNAAPPKEPAPQPKPQERPQENKKGENEKERK